MRTLALPAFALAAFAALPALAAPITAQDATPPGVTIKVVRIGQLLMVPGSNSNQPRDRVTVLNACLVLADGVLDNAQVARRAGFGALHPTAAAKIVARARSIVAAAS